MSIDDSDESLARRAVSAATDDDRKRNSYHFDRHTPEYREQFDKITEEMQSKCPMAWTEAYNGHWVAADSKHVFELARCPAIARGGVRGVGERSDQLDATLSDSAVFGRRLLLVVVAAPIAVPADANVAGTAASFLNGQAKPPEALERPLRGVRVAEQAR